MDKLQYPVRFSVDYPDLTLERVTTLLPSWCVPRYRKAMDQVRHPLDWWALGGYDEVIRHTGWNLAKARREVKKAIKAYGWNPIGHTGYEALRHAIMDGKMTDRDLV